MRLHAPVDRARRRHQSGRRGRAGSGPNQSTPQASTTTRRRARARGARRRHGKQGSQASLVDRREVRRGRDVHRRLFAPFEAGRFSPGSMISTPAALASRRSSTRNHPAMESSPVSSWRLRTSSATAAFSPSVSRIPIWSSFTPGNVRRFAKTDNAKQCGCHGRRGARVRWTALGSPHLPKSEPRRGPA